MIFQEFENNGHFDDIFEGEENSEPESEIDEGNDGDSELLNIITLDEFLFFSKITIKIHRKMEQMINLMFILNTIYIHQCSNA